MVARWSRTLIPTTRADPAEAEVPSHRLMVRAGLVRRLGTGLYTYLPAGWRVLEKICAVIRAEMERAGAAEMLMPALHPIELWEATGRRADYGHNLFVVEDRHGRGLALGPTHEEVVTSLVGAVVESYRDLPLTVYQIQTKFRDEYRPRFGVLRSREFQMKDAYSFHLAESGPGGLEETYRAQYQAYCRIFERCGIPYEAVEAATGPIGGSVSHEFMVPSPTGEDVILKSDAGGYAANVERAEIAERPWSLEGEPVAEMQPVHTPDCATIEDVCAYFKRELGSKLRQSDMLKTLVCSTGATAGRAKWVVAVVRGDHELNEDKLAAAFRTWCADFFEGLELDLHLADEAEAAEAGFAIGYVGPQIAADRDDVILALDPDVAQRKFWVTGANARAYHVKGFDWGRDAGLPTSSASDRHFVADIRNAVDGDPAPSERGGGTLRETRGIEVGHVFKLGTKYSESLEAQVLDEGNERRPIVMGCYGIGVNRILAAAIERQSEAGDGHDEQGIVWPAAIAPWSALITPIRYEGRVRETADALAEELEARGIDTLLDDRDERPGVKFNDGDLLGIPLRITVGEKGLKQGQLELKPRTASEPQSVPREEAADRAAEWLGRAAPMGR